MINFIHCSQEYINLINTTHPYTIDDRDAFWSKEVDSWIVENMDNRVAKYTSDGGGGQWIFLFAYEEDVMAFKLRWVE